MLKRSDLHKYQQAMISFMRDRRSCAVFALMGTGKTVSALTHIKDELDDFCTRRALIVAPLRVANSVWSHECKKWEHLAGLDIAVCTGAKNNRISVLNKAHDVTVINRENIPWLVQHYGAKWPFDLVVIDESSSFKSASSMRFKALKKIRHLIRDVIVMTGTPSPQGMMDLWSQIYLVDKGERLGRNITAFRSRYFDADYMGYNYTIKPGAADNIRQRISDIAISMDAAEFIDLPPRLDVIRRVDIGKKASEIYAELRDEFLTIINGDNVEALSAATVANKLLQCCNGAVYTDEGHAVLHSAKLDELADILDDHGGEPVLVAYNFKTDLLRLKERFPFAVELDKDPRTIERWNKGEIRLLLAQPASCGHGLNLQAGGSICVWYGLNWSLELYEQFNARLHRQGQSKPVTVCHIVAGGCIDEKVLSVINGKAKSQRDLIAALRYQI